MPHVSSLLSLSPMSYLFLFLLLLWLLLLLLLLLLVVLFFLANEGKRFGLWEANDLRRGDRAPPDMPRALSFSRSSAKSASFKFGVPEEDEEAEVAGRGGGGGGVSGGGREEKEGILGLFKTDPRP